MDAKDYKNNCFKDKLIKHIVTQIKKKKLEKVSDY